MITVCPDAIGDWCLRGDHSCNLYCYKRMIKYLNGLKK
jgi:hypothetical protein